MDALETVHQHHIDILQNKYNQMQASARLPIPVIHIILLTKSLFCISSLKLLQQNHHSKL